MPKPILKWVGGKTQLLEKIIPEFPKEIENYHEIFLGGGSVLLEFLTQVKKGNILISKGGKIFAYDLNETLIYLYKNIQNNPEQFFQKITEIIKEFNECPNTKENLNRSSKNLEEAKKSKENYFYWIRKKFNSLNLEEKKGLNGSAIFLFLNKTCFRGIFRTGPNGFNVPYGNYINPEIVNKEHILEIHSLIENVEFECRDFKESLKQVKEGDFVYLDPPYAPVSSISFVKYTIDGFNFKQHQLLFEIIHSLTSQNIKAIMSNSDVKLIRENFKEPNYSIYSVLAKRSINSKNPGDKMAEVIIKNF